jgi:hypothetical protein
LPTDDPAETRQYIRDPSDTVPVELQTILDTNVELPDGASPTGYRADGVELWLGFDGGDDAIYVAFDDDHVERWPRSAEVIACA